MVKSLTNIIINWFLCRETLWDISLKGTDSIPESLLVRGPDGKKYLTGKTEYNCQDDVGILLIDPKNKKEVKQVVFFKDELEKYVVLGYN